jgi:PqqD family protein of HPr-rel-A system
MSTCDSPRGVPATPRPARFDVGPLKQIAISESGFVFDPVSGQTFNMNPTALAAIRALKDGASPAALAALLAERYELEAGDDPLSDVEDFLSQLALFGLITKAKAEPR